MTSALPTTAPIHHAVTGDVPWWRRAVIYQIYPRSWADSNGDGVGDLPGITGRLPYLRDLGVDALWLSPFYTSPQADAGYDVACYRDVDPVFGTIEDADALIAKAHGLDLRVLVDLVPNHTSDEHPWFQAALASAPASPERERYIFRDGLGEAGELPPNNWDSVFGGPAWTRTTDPDGTPGQWYLHLFDVKQPDLDWENPEVEAMFEDVLRFWLDRGVDGFRVDVAHGLVKAPGLPDWDRPQHMLGNNDGTSGPSDAGERPPMWDQDGVHEIYRRWREILDSYNPDQAGGHGGVQAGGHDSGRDGDQAGGHDGGGRDGGRDRILVAEAWVEGQERVARYVRPDEMHQAFNFEFLQMPWRAKDIREVIGASFRAADAVGAPTTWVLSNHDVVRHASRLGLPVGTARPNGIGVGDPQPDAEVGLRRARAATTMMLALPGSAYLYQGEELGLPESTDMPDEARRDPTWVRSGHTERGRDGARVPMPWEAGRPSCGFGPGERTWLPQPASYRAFAVDQEAGVAGSTLELYRALLSRRGERALGSGSLAWLEGYAEDVVAFVNAPGAAEQEGAGTVVLVNLGPEPVALPGGAAVLLSSGPLTADGRVPTDTAVWAHR